MAKKIDLSLFFLVFLLSILGLINFFSASYYYSLLNFNNPYFYTQRFFLRIFLLGFLVFFIGYFLGQHFLRLKKIFLLLFFLAFVSLFLGFFPPFRLQPAVARWVDLGFISFQPSELIKPLAILFFIFLLSYFKKLPLWQKLIIFLFLLGLLLVPIFLQPALSNVLILGASLVTVFFFSLTSKKEIIISFLVLSLVFFLLIFLGSLWGYRLERLKAFLTKGEVYPEKYFQVEQAILGISSGGLWGKGLGKSEIKILGLPQMLTDSIFVIYAEEFGFVGSVFLLSIFLFLILKILLLGKQTEQIEKQSFAYAVSVWLFFQTFLHIASNVGLFVPTGVILPFFSYGASGQLAIYFSLGLISSFKS